MYQGRTLESFAAEIIRRKDNMKDFVAHTKQMRMENGDLFFGDENVSHSFPVNNIAAQQIASFTGIPSVYYNRMKEQNPALLDHNINAWFQDMDALRMVRTLDSRARAFLSDKYLPIDIAAEDIAQLYNGDRDFSADADTAAALVAMFEIPLDVITTRASEELHRATHDEQDADAENSGQDAAAEDMDSATVEDYPAPVAPIADAHELTDPDDTLRLDAVPYLQALANAQ